MDIHKLRRRARRHSLLINKDRRLPYDGYWLVSSNTNTVAAPGPMPLEQVDLWLDDLEKAQEAT